ncbi:hypothetical protein NliqN6_2812 [Naganishia liquefaciens]|uniref:Uncharacterized protein n=1 Tax=Naganishia liquefaciens TaxID=104408 RepID=A0A8H3YEC3_9TREE|nr:hypothetical protein NliqN6_2812 [Naganishia liquefaciens]
MACRTPLRPTVQEDWSNDGDFDFEDNHESAVPRIPSSLPKPDLNLISCDGRSVQMLSANVNRKVRLSNRQADDFGDQEEAIADGVMESSSSGSVQTTQFRYAGMTDLEIADEEDVEYPTIKGLESECTRTLKHGRGRSGVQAQVTGTALGGTAYITRLGSAGSRSKARTDNLNMDGDLDWGSSTASSTSIHSAAVDFKTKLNLRLANQQIATGNREDKWDDFDAGFDTDGEDDSKQRTLKAGTAPSQSVIEAKLGSQDPTYSKPANVANEGDDMEEGFQLPLTLHHLKLIPRSPQSAVLRHRSSRSSLASAATGQTSDWDNIGTPANARASGTSSRTASSVIPGTDQSEVDDHHARTRSDLDRDTEDDLEDGLELPVPSFFSNGRARELNKLLDRKRKPEVVSGGVTSHQTAQARGTRPSSTLMRPTLSSSAKLKYVPLAQDSLEDQLEDGLVLGDERTELTHRRLARIRQSRVNQGTPTGPRNAVGGTLKRGFISGRQKVDNASDAPSISRPASGSNGLLATPSNARIYQASPSFSALPPASLANTPSRLRHRTSQSRLGEAFSSSSLGKRQSMSSLRDAAKLHESTGFSMQHPPSRNALSYTAQTAASAARSVENPRKGSAESGWPNAERSRTPSERSYGIRSTSSSMNSKTDRPRAPIPPSFTQEAVFDESSAFAPSSLPISNKLRKLVGLKSYGDGTELDGIEDLQVDRTKEGMVKQPKETSSSVHGSIGRSAGQHLGLGVHGSIGRFAGQHLGLGRPSRLPQTPSTTAEKRKAHPTEPATLPRQAATSKGKPLARKAGLIRHLGRVEKKKVGDMIWNPETLRWEGNYQALRDFDAQVMSSARPALITHYGAFASMKATSSRSTIAGDSKHGNRVPSDVSPSVSAAPLNAPRIVGNMMFDPEKMCWISTLAAEDDEPDPFANIDEEDASDRQGSSGLDDQDDHFDEDGVEPLRGGTITKDMGRTMIDGIRARATGLMRFSSATTTSSLSSAGTSTTSQSSEPRRRRENFAGRLGAEDAEEWDVEVGVPSRKPGLHLPSTSTPGRSTSNRSSAQTDSGFKVKNSGNPVSSMHSSSPRYSRKTFEPTEFVSEALWRQSLAAETRHEQEMLGWRVDEKIKRGWNARDLEREREREKRREEKRLWEIRNLAMRS